MKRNSYSKFKHHVYKLSEMFSARDVMRGGLMFPPFISDSAAFRAEQTRTLDLLREMDKGIDKQIKLFVQFCKTHIEDRDLLLQIKLKGVEDYKDVEFSGDIFNILLDLGEGVKWIIDPTLGITELGAIPTYRSVGEWCGIYI